MQELRELLSGGPGDPGLDLAALQIATIEYPEVSPGSFLDVLDSYARELGERVGPDADGEEFIHTINEYLFEELGFQGNQQEYYHPANSCLNEVLTKRVGIPDYVVSRLHGDRAAARTHRPWYRTTRPFHRPVRRLHISPRSSIPFMRAVDVRSECFDLAREITGLDISADPEGLEARHQAADSGPDAEQSTVGILPASGASESDRGARTC